MYNANQTNFTRRGNNFRNNTNNRYSDDGQQVQDLKPDETLDFEVKTRSFKEDFAVKYQVITTNQEISLLISRIIGSVFEDFSGCIIEEMNLGDKGHRFTMLGLAVYFYMDYPGNSCGIERIDNPVNTDGFNLIRSYNSRFAKRRRYKLTKQAEMIFDNYLDDRLYNYRFENGKNVKKKTNWDPLVTEASMDNAIVNNTLYPQKTNETLIKVSGLDILKFIKKLYGEKTADGDDCIYKVSKGGPLEFKDGIPNNVIIIDQIKASDRDRIMDYRGRNMFSTGIPMYRYR